MAAVGGGQRRINDVVDKVDLVNGLVSQGTLALRNILLPRMCESARVAKYRRNLLAGGNAKKPPDVVNEGRYRGCDGGRPPSGHHGLSRRSLRGKHSIHTTSCIYM